MTRKKRNTVAPRRSFPPERERQRAAAKAAARKPRGGGAGRGGGRGASQSEYGAALDRVELDPQYDGRVTWLRGRRKWAEREENRKEMLLLVQQVPPSPPPVRTCVLSLSVYVQQRFLHKTSAFLGVLVFSTKFCLPAPPRPPAPAVPGLRRHSGWPPPCMGWCRRPQAFQVQPGRDDGQERGCVDGTSRGGRQVPATACADH